jgi:erythronate-4-phosphate dehydrogenase
MLIVADENIPGLDSTFGQHGEISSKNGREILPADLKNADALVVRSVTRVDAGLLAGTPVRFVGSTTIGVDHIDTEFLQQSGIAWCHAPGCNADAASQYTLAMILLACEKAGLVLNTLDAGIVGFGNVGKRLHRLLQVMGARNVFACDPPLADAGETGLVGMDQIAKCNLISFHVPLTVSGRYPTRHLASRAFLSQLQPGTLLVNTSRGQVVEASTLLDWLVAGKGHAALDVWPAEPRIDSRLLDAVTVATPHVAGYSLEGKLNGTRMVYRQFLHWLGLEPATTLPPGAPPAQPLDAANATNTASAILSVCAVARDDSLLRTRMGGRTEMPGAEFDRLRKDYPERRDFAGNRLPANCPESLARTLLELGFSATGT